MVTQFFQTQKGGIGFRTEINYIEIPRADGKWGTDHATYAAEVSEFCPDAEPEYPGFDPEIQHDFESTVGNFDQCTTDCGGEGQPDCNRKWQKKRLRRKWYEAGRIINPRMGHMTSVLKGEVTLSFFKFYFKVKNIIDKFMRSPRHM